MEEIFYKLLRLNHRFKYAVRNLKFGIKEITADLKWV